MSKPHITVVSGAGEKLADMYNHHAATAGANENLEVNANTGGLSSSDCYIVTVDLSNPNSIREAKNSINTIRRNDPRASMNKSKIVLVGTNDSSTNPNGANNNSVAVGKLAQQMGCTGYEKTIQSSNVKHVTDFFSDISENINKQQQRANPGKPKAPSSSIAKSGSFFASIPIVNVAVSIISAGFSIVKDLLGPIGDLFDLIPVNLIKSGFKAIPNIFKPIKAGITGIFKGIGNVFKGVGNFLSNIKTGIKGLFNLAKMAIGLNPSSDQGQQNQSQNNQEQQTTPQRPRTVFDELKQKVPEQQAGQGQTNTNAQSKWANFDQNLADNKAQKHEQYTQELKDMNLPADNGQAVKSGRQTPVRNVEANHATRASGSDAAEQRRSEFRESQAQRQDNDTVNDVDTGPKMG